MIAICFGLGAGLARAQDLTIQMPEALIAGGFDKHLLTRFRFKHRVAVEAQADAGADLALGPEVEGTQVFQTIEGEAFRLSVLTADPKKRDQSALLLDWLRSTPGKSAIEGFTPDGAQLFTAEVAVQEVVVEDVFDGDALDGARLALQHCGRCHVVDQRNRMGGIGSTPSFAALRGRQNWSDLFRAFYTENPHPSFTQVVGVTEPFDPMRAVHVAPMEITLDDVEAITAFVATIKPKDLGRPVQAQ